MKTKCVGGSIFECPFANFAPSFARGAGDHGVDVLGKHGLQNERESPRIQAIVRGIPTDNVKWDDGDVEKSDACNERCKVAHDTWPFAISVEMDDHKVVHEDGGTKLSHDVVGLSPWDGNCFGGRHNIRLCHTGFVEVSRQKRARHTSGGRTIIWMRRLAGNGVRIL